MHDGRGVGGDRGDHPAIVAPHGRNDGDVRRVSRRRDAGRTERRDDRHGPAGHDAMPDEAVSHSL